ncbi:MAG: hypothetical protein AB2792_15195 [Candidatus Thiodiazotropha sp.]
MEAMIQPVFAPFSTTSSVRQRLGKNSATANNPPNLLFLLPITLTPNSIKSCFYPWASDQASPSNLMDENYPIENFIRAMDASKLKRMPQVTNMKADNLFKTAIFTIFRIEIT